MPAQCVNLGTFTSKGTLPTNLVPSYTATQTSGMAASFLAAIESARSFDAQRLRLANRVRTWRGARRADTRR